MIIEEMELIQPPYSDQDIVQACIYRVRAILCLALGYKKGIASLVDYEIVRNPDGSRYARASTEVDRAEIEARGIEIDSDRDGN